MRTTTIALLAFGLVATSPIAHAQNPEALPTLPNAYNYTVDVNNKGEILGVAYGYAGGVKATRWVNGQISALDGYKDTIALAINDSGVIVGAGFNSPEEGPIPVTWIDGKPQELPTLGRGGIAYDINAKGEIVGWVNTQSFTAPAIWRNGQLTVLGSLRDWGGEARSIDADGTISGFSSSMEGDQIPTQWKAGEPTALPVSFGTNYIGVLGVNRTGMGRTAGYVVQRENAPDVGDYLISVAVAWQDGEYRVLQRPGDQGANYATDVTSQGVYVGSTTSIEGYPTPTLWDNDGGSRLPIDLGRSARAAGANDTGTVVGVDVTDPRNPIPVVWRLDSFPRLKMANFQAAKGATVALETLVSKAGKPMPNQRVTFQANGVTLGTSLSDSKGIARMNYRVPTNQVQPVPIMASLGGSNYLFRKVEIGKAAANAGVTPIAANRNKPITISVSLRNSDRNVPLASKPVSFVLRGRTVGTATTDAKGRAKLTYKVPANEPIGKWPLEARFTGDTTAKAVTARASAAINR